MLCLPPKTSLCWSSNICFTLVPMPEVRTQAGGKHWLSKGWKNLLDDSNSDPL